MLTVVDKDRKQPCAPEAYWLVRDAISQIIIQMCVSLEVVVKV